MRLHIHNWAYYSSGQRTCSLCKLRQVRPIGGDWEVESDGDTSTTTATMPLPEIPLKGDSK